MLAAHFERSATKETPTFADDQTTKGDKKGKYNMADQILKDRNGNRIGSIETRSDGTQIGKDKNGNRRGEYDPKRNITKDKNGNRVGEGNLLSSLITQL